MPFIGKSPQVGAFQLIDSITTSATDTYALTVSSSAYVPESARNLIVSLNGVTQAPETAYTVSGSNIVFASALTASDVIDYILVIGDAVDIGTPSDNTVGDAQLKAALDLSSKTLTFANDQISGDVINGGTISSFASTGIDDNATSTAITINSSERVGIKTTSLNANLEISGNTTTGGEDVVQWNNSNGVNKGMLQLSSAGGGQIQLRDAGNTVDVQISSTTDSYFNGGNVGIGTTNPTYKLVVSNNGEEGLEIDPVSDPSTIRTFYYDRNTAAYIINKSFADQHVWSAGGSSEKMRLNGSGNLGIGTTTPAEKLTVVGEIISGAAASTSGQVILKSEYLSSSNDFLNILGTQRSNSAWVLGYGVKPSPTTSGVFLSTADNSNFKRGALVLQEELIFMNAASQQTSVDSTVTLTERMRIDSSGNVGIGLIPSSWWSGMAAVETQASSGGVFASASLNGHFLTNAYYDGSNWKYKNSGPAEYYSQTGGTHQFLTASSGSAGGNISWSEAMRISSDGQLKIGGTTDSPANVRAVLFGTGNASLIYNTGHTGLHINNENATAGIGNYGAGISFGRFASNSDDQSAAIVPVQTTADQDHMGIAFLTHDTNTRANPLQEKMRIMGSGNVGIGTTSPSEKLEVSGSVATRAKVTSTGSSVQYMGSAASGGLYIDSTGSAPDIIFRNTGSFTERMRIDSSGNLLVGTTFSVGNSGRFQAVRSNTGAIGYFEVDNGSGVQNAVDITNAANAAFVPLRFWVNGYAGSLVGSISCTTSGTAFNATSDVRVKENIVDAPAGNIDAIRVRSFDWKADGTHQPYGMIAQELVEVAPEAVTQGETDDDMWGVDYSKLVPMMIKEIQDLKAEVAALKGA